MHFQAPLVSLYATGRLSVKPLVAQLGLLHAFRFPEHGEHQRT
jgi:hypothetical protein